LSDRPYRPQDGEYIPDNVLLGTYKVSHSWGNAKATSITIHNADGKYDGLVDGSELLIDRSITILAGDTSWPLMSDDGYDDKFVPIFTGRITGGNFRNTDALQITADSLKKVFDSTTIGLYLVSEGTGRHQRFHYIVGESQLFAPLILGRCFNVPVVFARNWHAASKITVDPGELSQFTIGNWVYATKDNAGNGSPVTWAKIIKRDYNGGNSDIYVAQTKTSVPGSVAPYYGFTRSDGVTQTIFESTTDPGPIGSPTGSPIADGVSQGSPVIYDYPEFLVGLGDLEIANVRWKGAPLVENYDYAVYTDDVTVSQNTNTYTVTATFVALFSVPTELNSLGFDTTGGVANLTVDVNGFRSIANLTNNRYFRLSTISANSVDRTYDECYRGKIYDPTQDDANKSNLSRYLYWANFDNVLIDTTQAYADFSGSPGEGKYDWSVAVYADSLFGSPNPKNFFRYSPYSGTGSFRLKATGAFSIYPAEYDVVYSAPSYFKSLSIFSQYTVDNEGSNNWETWNTRLGSPCPGYVYVETFLEADTFKNYIEDPSGLKDKGSGLNPVNSYTAKIHTTNIGSPLNNVQVAQTDIISGASAANLRDYFHTGGSGIGGSTYDLQLYTSMNPFNISSSFEMGVRLLFDYVFSNIESPYTKSITLGSPNIIGSPGSPVASSAGKLKWYDPYLLNYIYEDQVVIIEKLSGQNVPQALNDNNTSTFGYYRIKNLTVRSGFKEDFNIVANDPTIYLEFNLANRDSRDTIKLTPGSPGVGVGSFVLHTTPLINNNETFKNISSLLSYVRLPAEEFADLFNNQELIVKDPSGNILELREQVGDAQLRTLYDYGKLDDYDSQYNLVPVSYGAYKINGQGSPTVYNTGEVDTIDIVGSPLSKVEELDILPLNLQQIGMVIKQETTVGRVLQDLVKPMNTNYVFDSQGAIKFFKFYPPDMAYNELTKSEQLVIDNDANRYIGMHDIQLNSVKMVNVEPMTSSVEYKARKNYTKQSKDSLAGMVIDTGAAERYENDYLTTITQVNDLNSNIDPSLFSKKEVVQSFNYDPAEAAYNARRRINLRKQPRKIVELSVPNRYGIEVGDLIYVAFNRYGLFRAIGEPIITDLGEDLVTEVLEIILTAWAGGYTFIRCLVLSSEFDHTTNTLKLEVWQ
jgi:hypothetical protein